MSKDEKTRLGRIYKESRLKPPYTGQSLGRRFWTFQNERIPLIAMSLITLSLTAAVAKANGSPEWTRVFIAGFMATLYFLQIRLADEPKDYEHDNKYYPRRPVQRGVITLRELAYIKNASITGFLGLSASVMSLEIFILACFQQFYSYLTRQEFFIREWLREHFITYQFSHYVQLLILDWLILTILGIRPLHEKLLYFAFVIIMIGLIESSRTIGGTDGVKAKDRYSYRLGVNLALASFVGFTLAASGLTVFLIRHVGGDVKWFILALGLFAIGWSVIKYKQKPVMKQAEVMNVASLVMYLCCASALFLSK